MHAFFRARRLRPCLSTGVTLIELSITLGLCAIVLALALPHFTPLLNRWRTQHALGTLIDTLHFSRAEAIRRGGNVVIRKNANHTAGCTLAPGPADWGCGWLIFDDRNADGQLSAGEDVLRWVSIPPGLRVGHGAHAPTASTAVTAAAIRVNRWGKMDGLGAKHFTVSPTTDEGNASTSRSLCISAGGRIRTVQGASC